MVNCTIAVEFQYYGTSNGNGFIGFWWMYDLVNICSTCMTIRLILQSRHVLSLQPQNENHNFLKYKTYSTWSQRIAQGLLISLIKKQKQSKMHQEKLSSDGRTVIVVLVCESLLELFSVLNKGLLQVQIHPHAHLFCMLNICG